MNCTMAGRSRFIDPLHESREEEEEYVRTYVMEAYRFYGYGMWLAFHQKTGELIGRAGLTNREIHGETVLEMGYLVGERYQRQGYATELCRGILRYAQEGTGFREVNCLIQKENLVSVHLAENLGFSWQEELDIFGKKMQRYVKILD